MRLPRPTSLATLAMASLLLTLPSCEEAKKYDWKNREISWTYGPTRGAATSVHLNGTGTKGSPIAAGWKVLLSDGKTLTVKPYKLAKSHALFGKCKMIISLFNKGSEQIHTMQTEAITADNATFTFELTEEQAKPAWDSVIWFRKL